MGAVRCKQFDFDCSDGGVKKIECWKSAMKLKGLRVNMDRIRDMWCKNKNCQANQFRIVAVCSA